MRHLLLFCFVNKCLHLLCTHSDRRDGGISQEGNDGGSRALSCLCHGHDLGSSRICRLSELGFQVTGASIWVRELLCFVAGCSRDC